MSRISSSVSPGAASDPTISSTSATVSRLGIVVEIDGWRRTNRIADDGSVAREVCRVAYLKEDVDDPDFTAWVDVDPASVDGAEPLEAQRVAVQTAARRREGIA
jgi:hypothetical protein